MGNLKQILSITLPITILLLIAALFGEWSSSTGGIILLLVIVQGVFWKFVKWGS